ncbi:MAG: hypothetical protein H6999_03535 [Hahellaceae bacterium]|nr:hypothetical protein [Hahellaceae bacterium]MCP5168810.1 hypothetical protein [Hahellaceae bacterium]
MTAQLAETLIYQGHTMGMCTTPLNDYFALGGNKPDFAGAGTMLWRRYVGTWEVVNERLYLIALRGNLTNGTEANLATLFPDYPERVFAHWYSGTLRIPKGKLIKYVHAGFASTYEQDLYLVIEKGILTNSAVRENGTSTRVDAPVGYGIGGMLIPSNTKPQGSDAS